MESSSRILWNGDARHRNPQTVFTHDLRQTSESEDRDLNDPLRQYDLCVLLYKARQLTFPGDILRAFSGISAVLEKNLRSPCLLGLPVALFDLVILWRASGFERRPGFPSWSWAGWFGSHDLFSHALRRLDSNRDEFLCSHTWIQWNYYDANSSRFIPLQKLLEGKDHLESMEMAYKEYFAKTEWESTALKPLPCTAAVPQRFNQLPNQTLSKFSNDSDHSGFLEAFTATAFFSI